MAPGNFTLLQQENSPGQIWWGTGRQRLEFPGAITLFALREKRLLESSTLL